LPSSPDRAATVTRWASPGPTKAQPGHLPLRRGWCLGHSCAAHAAKPYLSPLANPPDPCCPAAGLWLPAHLLASLCSDVLCVCVCVCVCCQVLPGKKGQRPHTPSPMRECCCCVRDDAAACAAADVRLRQCAMCDARESRGGCVASFGSTQRLGLCSASLHEVAWRAALEHVATTDR
jgi:hypothetical protein